MEPLTIVLITNLIWLLVGTAIVLWCYHRGYEDGSGSIFTTWENMDDYWHKEGYRYGYATCVKEKQNTSD